MCVFQKTVRFSSSTMSEKSDATKHDVDIGPFMQDILDGYNAFARFANKNIKKYQLQHRWHIATDFFIQNPIFSTVVAISVITCATPVLLFMLFVFCTSFCMIMSFLVVEGAYVDFTRVQ